MLNLGNEQIEEELVGDTRAQKHLVSKHAKVKKMCIYISILPCVFMVCLIG
jgi:hypothetical protein